MRLVVRRAPVPLPTDLCSGDLNAWGHGFSSPNQHDQISNSKESLKNIFGENES